MCGIVGIAAKTGVGESERDCIRKMADVIEHRGPDDDGFYDSGQVLLGMRRLSIIDVEGGQQPTCNEDRTVWAVCNGEIYNFRRLRQELSARGHQFRTLSDTEVIVHLYEEHGQDFVDHIDGMFAIALWDSVQRKLFVVRDRMGIKPLYYTVRNGDLAFGSEIKSLLKLPWLEARLDRSGLRDYLSVGYSVAPRTIFGDVRKLPPATMLCWSSGEQSIRRYWDMPVDTRDDLDEEEWTGRVADGLADAVDSHMVSDVPIGAFLSGGVDSTAIVAFMAERSGQAVSTYSIGYAGDKAAEYYNELPYANFAAQLFSTEHNEIEVRPEVAKLLPHLIWHLEEPISDSAIATTFLVAQLAASDVKVILSGVGGDELFAGYNRYLGDHYGGMYQHIPAWIRRRILQPMAAMLPTGRQNKWMDYSRYARSFVKAASMPWREQYKYFIAIQEQAMLEKLLGDPSLREPDGFDRILEDESADDDLLRLLRVDWQTQLAEDLLLLTDKMTMAESLECRVPFLDHHFVEMAASIPKAVKRPGGELKHILKQALKPHLPDSILYRKKRGFGAPVGSWFKGQLRPLRAQLLSREVVESRGVFSWPAVSDICRLHDESRQDYTDLILVLMNLEIWSKIFLDGRSAADVSTELVES